jgi:hypothetical protein
VKQYLVPKEEEEPTMAQQDTLAVTEPPQGDVKSSISGPSVQMCVLNEAIAVVMPSISAQ